MNNALNAGCAEIFREVSGLDNSSAHYGWSDERSLSKFLWSTMRKRSRQKISQSPFSALRSYLTMPI